MLRDNDVRDKVFVDEWGVVAEPLADKRVLLSARDSVSKTVALPVAFAVRVCVELK